MREIYLAAKESGIPSPIDNPPQFQEYLIVYHNIFYDVLSFKTDHDSFMPLSLIESYQNLLDTKIHSFIIRMIIQFDRIHTITVNEISNSGK